MPGTVVFVITFRNSVCKKASLIPKGTFPPCLSSNSGKFPLPQNLQKLGIWQLLPNTDPTSEKWN